MKMNKTSFPVIVSLAFFGLATFTAQARWSYDSANKVIVDTDGETVRWSIPVTVWNGNLALNGTPTVGEGVLDLTNFREEADCGYDVTAIRNYLQGTRQNIITEFIAPHITSVSGSGIGYYARKNTSVTRIVLSDDVTTLDANSTYGLTALTNISPRVFRSLTTAPYFKDCSSLTGTLEFPNATSVGGEAFSGCACLQDVRLPLATSVGNRAFEGCAELTNVSLSAELTTIGNYSFKNCVKLEEVLPGTFPSVVSIGEDAFYYTTALKTMPVFAGLPLLSKTAFRYSGISGDVSFEKLEMVGLYCFDGCPNLTGFYGPCVTNVDGAGFSNCSSLTNVVLAENLQNVGYAAFANDPELVSVSPIFGKGMKTVASMAYQNCPKLASTLVLDCPDLVPSTPVFYGTTRISNIVVKAYPPDKSFAKLSDRLHDGVSVWFYGDPLSDQNDIQLEPWKNWARFYIKNGKRNPKWLALTSPLTATEKARADYPGKNTFGKLKNGIYAINWSTLGLSVIVR